jgi:hypothetical protein
VNLREVDLGPCAARIFDVGTDRWVLLLPGARYSPDAPVLWFAREAAQASGHNVLAVYDTWRSGGDPIAWVRERAEAALEHIGPARPVVIAKSLTTLAAPIAAERDLPAIWLTPLIHSDGGAVADAVVAGLRAASAPRLLVGGSADPSWDGERAPTLGEVLEIADGDHQLQVPDDLPRSLDALRTVTQRLTEFLAVPGLQDQDHRYAT